MILVEIPSKTYKLNEDILVKDVQLDEPTNICINNSVVEITNALNGYPLMINKIRGYSDYDGLSENIYTVTGAITLKVVGKILGKNLYYHDICRPFTRYKVDDSTNKIVRENKSYSIAVPCEANTTYAIQKTGGNVFGVGYSTDEIVRPSSSIISSYSRNDSASNMTITTGDNAKWIVIYLYYASGSYKASEVNDILATLQVEKGNQATPYESCNIEHEEQDINLGSLELANIINESYIITYEDYIYFSNAKWYKHKEVEKIASYNGETITTDYISSTGSLTTGATVYYGVDATEIEIMDATLISQLNNIKNFVSYSENMNIYTSATSHPYFDVSYYTQDDVTVNSKIVDTIDGYIDNKEAMKQAIYHILRTERYDYLIYSNNYGVELRQYIGESFQYLENTIEQTLRDALTYDLRIKDVVVNKVEQKDSDKAVVNFTAYTIYGDLQLEVSVVV